MKILLRSMIVANPAAEDGDLARRNYFDFRKSGLTFAHDQHRLIFEFIRTFVESHNHVPKAQTIRQEFTRRQEIQVVDSLDLVLAAKPIYRGDFTMRLEQLSEESKTQQVHDILKSTADILVHGREEKLPRGQSRFLKGPVDAAQHFLALAHDIVAPTTGENLSGEVTRDGESVWDRYELVESDPEAGIGRFTGIEPIDTKLKGVRKGQLWTHAAFTGHGKSLLSRNWAYNQSVYAGASSVIFSLEMSYAGEVRESLYAMHSLHPKFKEIRLSLGVQEKPDVTVGLPLERIVEGTLDAGQRKFYRDYVIDDFGDQRHGKIHVEVASPDKADFTVADARAAAELKYSSDPFDLIFIDHALLMSPRRKMSSTTENLNEVMRDLKKMAQAFNRGAMIPVVALFQMSREGFKSASSTGRYNLTHLSYANECLVTGTPVWTDRGLVGIESVKVGDRVWSSTGWKPVLDHFNQGIRPTFQVELDSGADFRATRSHRVRVVRKSGLEWCAVGDLSPGDLVARSTEYSPAPVAEPDLPPLEFRKGEKPQGEQGIPLLTPTYLNEDLSYLLGVWDGDGKVHPKGVGFTGNRRETSIRDRIRAAFKAVFGHEIGLTESPSRPGSFDLLKWSQPLKRWFEDVAGPRGVEVPASIWNGSVGKRCEYLKGLFDADGWISSQKNIGLKMKSRTFLQQVQSLLTMHGIDSRVSRTLTTLKATGETYVGYELVLRGLRSRQLFRDLIGFTNPEKAARLAEIDFRRSRDRTRLPVAPVFVELSREYCSYTRDLPVLKRSHFNARRLAELHGYVTRGQLRRLVEFLVEKKVSDHRLFAMQTLLRCEMDTVVSVQATGLSEQVWDIEVDGDHEYQAGPVLHHNCERSSDVVTASWATDAMKKTNRIRFQCLKSRSRAPFDDFLCRCEWHNGRILNEVMTELDKDGKETAAVKAEDYLDMVNGIEV